MFSQISFFSCLDWQLLTSVCTCCFVLYIDTLLGTMKRTRDEEKPNESVVSEFIRAVYWHEEGVLMQSKTWRLPTSLPEDLEKTYNFLKVLVPDAQGKVGKMPNPKSEGCTRDPLVNGLEPALWCFPSPIWDQQEYCFDKYMNRLCGEPVVNAVGRIHMVMVPTFE